ncbi:MAG TPA: hypothetical protein V6D08_08980 [Candidatus Obscuribacterales bacterium]
MATINEKYLQRLRDAGLHVSHPMGCFNGGVWVCKPTTTPGNAIPGYEGGYITIGEEPPCPDTDAAMVALMQEDDTWIVWSIDCAGGMGYGDFENRWSTPEEAITDILDFYFGNPERMAKKAARRAGQKPRGPGANGPRVQSA